MNSDFDPLERNVHRLLRSLPDRAAPSGLETRVMAALAQRAALPWWRRSYAGWPVAVRILFFLVAGGAAAISVVGLSRVPALASAPSVLANWRVVYYSLIEITATLVAAVPRIYLYGMLGVLGACYITLMGVGAAFRSFLVRS
jgi:hypothetical protein